MDTDARLKKYFRRIPADDLDQPIDYKNKKRGQYIHRDLGKIADAMEEWEGDVAIALDLNPAEIAQIKEKYQDPNKRRYLSASAQITVKRFLILQT
jgi:hypothetical protein